MKSMKTMKRSSRRENRRVRGATSAARGPQGARPQRFAGGQRHASRRLRPLHLPPTGGAKGGAENGAQAARSNSPAPSAPGTVREIPTIVEYSAIKRPANQYPKRIVSPPRPQSCCTTGMVALGKPRREAGWFYVYKRCDTCGFTVRSIVRRDPAAAKMPFKASFN